MAIRGSSGVVSPRVRWPSSGGWPWSGLGAVQSRLALLEHREDDGGTSARLVRGLSAMVRGPAGRKLVRHGSDPRHPAPDEADSEFPRTRPPPAARTAPRGGRATTPREVLTGPPTNPRPLS